LIARRFVGAVVGRGRFVLGVGRVRVRGCPLVPTNLGLALPIALIQRSDELLERAQFGGLANACDLILETLQETFVILAGQGNFVPTCVVSMSVEFDRITVMRRTQVHARIYACCMLSCRLHSISMTETNTLTYTRRHTITCAVTRTLYALDMHYSKF